MEKKDGTYYLVEPWYRGLKYEVKNWKVWRIWIYREFWWLDWWYERKQKLEILNEMKSLEKYSDSITDCRYEDEEWFKKWRWR